MVQKKCVVENINHMRIQVFTRMQEIYVLLYWCAIFKQCCVNIEGNMRLVIKISCDEKNVMVNILWILTGHGTSILLEHCTVIFIQVSSWIFLQMRIAFKQLYKFTSALQLNISNPAVSNAVKFEKTFCRILIHFYILIFYQYIFK